MRATHDTSLLQRIITSSLPANCTPEMAVERTLEFVLMLEALVNDPVALRFLYRTVISHAGASGTGPLHAALSGEIWREETPPVPAPTKKKAAKPEEPDDQLLTQKQLAKRWSVSVMTLNRWRRDGRLRYHFMGRQIRFRMADVLEFEADGRV
jgi:excisionase family DNA binding protein